MFKPKDIGDKTTSSSTPLIKWDDNGKRTLFVVLVTVFIVAGIYVLGIFLNNPVLTGAAFVIGAVSILLIILFHRRHRSEYQVQTEAEIDAEVERYKQDLVDTYVGYDLEYSVEDVLDAADQYRETLEIENASVLDVDPATFVKMLGEEPKKNANGVVDEEASEEESE